MPVPTTSTLGGASSTTQAHPAITTTTTDLCVAKNCHTSTNPCCRTNQLRIIFAFTSTSAFFPDLMSAGLKSHFWCNITVIANDNRSVYFQLIFHSAVFPIAIVPLHSIGPTILVPSPTGHPIPRSNFRFVLQASGFVSTNTWLVKNRFNVLLIPFKCSILLRFICMIPSIIQYFCAAARTIFKQSMRRVTFDDFPHQCNKSPGCHLCIPCI